MREFDSEVANSTSRGKGGRDLGEVGRDDVNTNSLWTIDARR